jgi:hypothetical protein
MLKNIALFLMLVIFVRVHVSAQDVDSLLNSITTPKTDYESATFKASRIINGHSIEQMKAQQLDVRFHHRFGPVNSGAYELWGLDQSNVFFGLEYGVTDWLMLGVGRTSYEKTYNGFAKFRLWRQSKGEATMPVAISAYTGMDLYSIKWPDPTRQSYFSSRFSYIFQVLVARKFTEELSLQLTPTVIHRNLVLNALENNDTYALGAGGRYKLTTRISFNAEYYYVIERTVTGQTKKPNSLSFGFDIETGGHVFQIMLSNSVQMIERGFIAENTETWTNGGIHLGFNISRVFSL